MALPTAPTVPVRDLFARFWPYTRALRLALLTVVGLSVLAPVLQLATIWLFKVLVDQVLVPQDLSAFVPITGAYTGIILLAAGVAFCRSYLSRWVAQHFILALRTDLFAHLHSLSTDVLEGRQLGDLLARLTSDVRAIERLVVSGVTRSLNHGLRIVLFTGALLWLHWSLALVALAVLPLFGWAVQLFAKRIKTASRVARHYNGVMTSAAEESLGNAPLVQAYQRQATEVARFHEAGRQRLRARLDAARLQAGFAPLVDGLKLIGVLSVIGLGTWQIAAGRLTLGGLLAFVGYLSGLFTPVRGLAGLVTTVYAASAGAERISELLDSRSSVREADNALSIGRADGHLSLERVSFCYPGATHKALDDVSLHISPGEVLALAGPSGAGKSTVARLIMRLHDPVDGHIRLDGHDTRELSLHSLRHNIAAVLQETLVFNGTISDNIAYGRAGASADDIRWAARAADVDSFVRHLPDGYDTRVGERGRKLSGGQRQRIAIARALIRDAPILLLDEPLAGLDPRTGARIAEPLRRLMTGRTTLVIAHDPRTVEQADRVLELSHGRIVRPECAVAQP